MTSVWKRICRFIVPLVAAGAAAIAQAPAAHAALGDEVSNTAYITMDTGGGEFQFQTNPAIFTIEARTTPSQVEFFRLAPGSSGAVSVMLNGTEYSPSGDLTGPFLPIAAISGIGVSATSMPAQVELVPAEVYLSGEPVIVRVTDTGQNGDPTQIETIVATVTTSTGDTITLGLFEDSVDSGQFYGVFPSTSADTALNDETLSAPQDTVLTATYIDAFDASEVSVDTALVDPFGLVFDSFTGDPVSGARVTIVDAVSGQPAQVFGLDGLSTYPSTIITGSTVTDSGGQVYRLESGQFLFPLMAPGDYRLQIESPEGYAFPSTRSRSDIQSLNNGPFELIDGSFGGIFTVLASGPLNLDVPLDPNGELTIIKTASEARGSVGDFIGYTVELDNQGTVPAPYSLRDTLPRGFRYISGTARLNGQEIADPRIGSNGRVLTFQNGVVRPGEIERLTYLVAVGPGTPDGSAVNTAVAQNAEGAAISNVAEASIIVEDDLLRSRLTIIGRVVEAACKPDETWARSIDEGQGVKGVRLYMETGRYVVTDENGMYHFEGITPGTHVVQVDKATLPEGYEPVICEENSRYAGSALSKFVDATGGTVWRANFYLRNKAAAEAAKANEWTQPKLYQARPVEDLTSAIADGESQPFVTMQIKDANGKPVEKGRGVSIDIGDPYELIRVSGETGDEGQFEFELDPTHEAGPVPLKVRLAAGEPGSVAESEAGPETAKTVEEKSVEEVFDETWLNQQVDPEPRWVYPMDGATPQGRSVDVGILHGPREKIKLILNDRPAGSVNFAGRELSQTRDVAMSRWTGIDIQRGKNTIVAEVSDQEDRIVQRLERTIWFIDEVQEARLVADQTVAVADGRTRPVMAVRLEDAAGHAVHQGRIVDISVSEPYRLAQAAEREFEAPVASAYSNVAGVRVGKNGVALVELEPTLQAGRVRVEVQLQDDRTEVIDVWLKPEKREWVLVGLAEAEGLLTRKDGEGDDGLEDEMTDGRIAFFAKGMVKGDWLLTMAIDTSKRRGKTDGELFDEIDPNAYYTLYGDRTWQYNDAESRYPVYVKLERDTFQALFGDFETGLDHTELGRYSRRLSGAKVDYHGENLSVTAFASETNQTFRKDEIAADGTSGPYRVSQAPMLRSSEIITVETRERLRPDQVIGLRTLTRYVDYEIDYVTGEIFFRLPVDAADASFNPNVIVVDYETADAGDRGVTAGGRAAIRTSDERAELGVTLLREEASAGAQTSPSDLIAVDVVVQLDSSTQVRAELATSRTEDALGETSGEAWLVEAARKTQSYSAIGYYREEGEGFGLGQQGSNTAATRRIGAQLSAELGVKDISDGNDRSVRQLTAQAYREENLTSEARRDVAEIGVSQDSQTFGAGVGFRAIRESYPGDGEERQSALMTAHARASFVDLGLTLSVSHDQPVLGGISGEGDDEATLFPQRTVFGADKSLGRRATLNVRHELTEGGTASGDNTVVGVTVLPWAGGQVRALTDRVSTDSSERIGATVGVDQTWQVNDAWRLSGGLARRANVSGDDVPRDVTPDAAVSPLEDGVRSALVQDDDYTSAYLGAGYRASNTALGGRVEHRDSELGRRLLATVGGAREVSETLSFSSAARYQHEHLATAPDTESLDVRIGAAWRPRGEGLVILNRFDVGHAKVKGQSMRTKAVNNLALNTMLTKRTQASLYHGAKYVKASFEGAEAEGFTHLIGGELRHDITPKIDIGLQGQWWSGEASKTAEWSIGPSIGYTPAKNVWVSLGYNFKGFEDEDFEAARYSREGLFVKFRAKFDQDTVKGLIKDLGLGAE